MTIEEKFMERVFVVTEGSGCWLWTGNLSASGRPVIRFPGESRKRYAAPVALELFKEPAPPLRFALHTCHNALCVNPNHLYWGTKKQNAKDMIDAGRHRWNNATIGAKGMSCPASRFTDTDIIEMRRLHWQEGESYAAIGRQFHVNSGRVHNICTGKRWGHLKDGLPNPQQQSAQTTTRSKIFQCIAVLSILRNTLLRSVS